MCEPSSPAVVLGTEQFFSQQVQKCFGFLGGGFPMTLRVLMIHSPVRFGFY